jgi:hypothetical protein
LLGVPACPPLVAAQVGASQWFDLVDYDQLPASRTFRVRKLTRFSDFKQQVRNACCSGGSAAAAAAAAAVS